MSTAIKRAPVNPAATRTKAHLDHRPFFTKPMATGPEVTARCLECHKEAAAQVMKTPHWLWISGDVQRNGKTVLTGKRNLMNNFCISVSGNWNTCTKCHAGYGWGQKDYDFTKAENVDCLVCHDGTGTYVKSNQGLPGKKVDLAAVAGSVRVPHRENCGACHFNGGGGMGVKHGDLDNSLLHPNEDTDVHMARLGFQCIDCHTTREHLVAGKFNTTYTNLTRAARFDCADCHSQTPHGDAQLNNHVRRIACQTCHIPQYSRRFPTKMTWDWSKAGDFNRNEDAHDYLIIKGEFKYEQNVVPQYAWYNGRMDRYIMGDRIATEPLNMNRPLGSKDDPDAKIWPFKIHRGKQIYDPINRVLIPPVTSGEGGFWSDFDWNFAARKGMEVAGLPYSGTHSFISTQMYWPINHMTAPAKKALTCNRCHSKDGQMDWKALGFDGDPVGGTRHDR
ncbi:MAG: tetrathionate reductase family octaheme c-type cytochrome [Firmicutes bacterium]|nr:tetrathionate reductase family octaheme c-type cytochrome [Bacillota bacterium]